MDTELDGRQKTLLTRAEEDLQKGYRVTVVDRHGRGLMVSTVAELHQWMKQGFYPW